MTYPLKQQVQFSGTQNEKLNCRTATVQHFILFENFVMKADDKTYL